MSSPLMGKWGTGSSVSVQERVPLARQVDERLGHGPVVLLLIPILSKWLYPLLGLPGSASG